MAALNALASLLLLVGMSVDRAPVADAGWIDPDTPEDART
eukprot:CAMPEP_0113573946 /NCGR_PEP_ID=MMETSP0015_2-20120614/26888_1 /TAXON_ID=2838 /ORGANISM="Odontella" /LENGTH=39 /DNA_ID=CAMNT_0000477057 /DNA_START=171 /DNA_END=287 /DNA_ORIENTATION=- /assembly_acc=CAM_ASM_000160